MPTKRQPFTLSKLCIDNIINKFDEYWLDENKQLMKCLKQKIIPLYIIGPFEALKSHEIEYVLKTFTNKKKLTKYHLYILLHFQLRQLDTSFIKQSIFSSTVSKHIGNNCFNLVELSLAYQTKLEPTQLIDILRLMKRLKKLNLSHTKTNFQVTQQIAKSCKQLESLHLENCIYLYDDCIELIVNSFSEKLNFLNLDNIKLSNDIVESILKKCINLKFLYVMNLVNIVENIEFEENVSFKSKKLKLEIFYIDSDMIIKESHMLSLINKCPNLKNLRINCIGSADTLRLLNQFNYLNELFIANTNSLFSFTFGGFLLDALKTSFGKQLQSLSLVNLVDTNLRLIAKHCPNLQLLHVEFIDYYMPAVDKVENEVSDSNENSNQMIKCIKPLRHLYISNTSQKSTPFHYNIGQFRLDLILLLSNANVKYLELNGLDDLDDAYFQCLFTTLTDSDMLSKNLHISDSIETLKLTKMNDITAALILQSFISSKTSFLRTLDLNACKQISLREFQYMKYLVKSENLDLAIRWE